MMGFLDPRRFERHSATKSSNSMVFDHPGNSFDVTVRIIMALHLELPRWSESPKTAIGKLIGSNGGELDQCGMTALSL